MAHVFGFRPKQPVVWFHRQKSRSNRCCLYCGRSLIDGSLPSDKEHLIGCDFVPNKAFATGQEFNFIFRACRECNAEKGEMERHVSAVTMFASPARATHSAVNESAQRKADGDYHPVKKKLVRDAWSELSVESKAPGFSLSIGMLAPPQLVPEYVHGLAFRHIQGLFSLVTTKDPRGANEGIRLLPPAHFRLMGYYAHGDWGNPQLVEVGRRVRDWPMPVVIHTAGGCFRAVMRRQEGERGEWFWALEWNKSLRVVGGLTDRNQPVVFDGLPELDWKWADPATRFRPERRLVEGEDTLFPWPGE